VRSAFGLGDNGPGTLGHGTDYVGTGRLVAGRAGLLISTPEAGAPTTTIGLDRASGNPFIYMYSGRGASIFATFVEGEASLRLTNEDGTRLILAP
jgi:hypothetical protein